MAEQDSERWHEVIDHHPLRSTEERKPVYSPRSHTGFTGLAPDEHNRTRRRTVPVVSPCPLVLVSPLVETTTRWPQQSAGWCVKSDELDCDGQSFRRPTFLPQRSDAPSLREIKEHPAAALVPLLSSHLRVLALRFSILQGHNDTVVMNLARFGRIDLRLSKLTVFLGVIMMMRPGIGTAEETNAAFAATWAHAASEVAQIGEAWVGEKRTVVLSVSALIPGVDYSEFGEVAVEHTEYKEVRRHHRMTFKIVRADG
jgi:hypothetical protein